MSELSKETKQIIKAMLCEDISDEAIEFRFSGEVPEYVKSDWIKDPKAFIEKCKIIKEKTSKIDFSKLLPQKELPPEEIDSTYEFFCECGNSWSESDLVSKCNECGKSVFPS